MTVSQILKASSLPVIESEILIAFLLDKEKEFLITHSETEISTAVYKKFKFLEKKRLAGWSSAFLVGQKEFYGLDFMVDKNVLVPRPETEMMVDEVLDILGQSTNDSMLVDLGTGSGAIIISCADQIKKVYPDKYRRTIFRAIDISSKALRIAKRNSVLNKQERNIKFLSGNLLEPLINKNDFGNLSNRELIIAANLPYLTPRQVKTSPSIQKEPRLALVAGSDGLKYYRELFTQLKGLKKTIDNKNNPIKPITILCEIDSSQNKSIKKLALKYFSKTKLEIKKDLAGLNRLVIIKLY
jgi:release factor glutamine methyltransferase